jgi:hypothetical protein
VTSVGDSGDDYRFGADQGLLVRLSLVVRGSFLAFVATLGVLFLVVAIVLSKHVPLVHDGVLSAMFAVWAASAFIYAAFGHLGLRLIGYH